MSSVQGGLGQRVSLPKVFPAKTLQGPKAVNVEELSPPAGGGGSPLLPGAPDGLSRAGPARTCEEAPRWSQLRDDAEGLLWLMGGYSWTGTGDYACRRFQRDMCVGSQDIQGSVRSCEKAILSWESQ